MDPTFLKVREARILDQVNPGTLTYMTNIFFMGSLGMYSAYVLRTLGPRGLFGKAVIPIVGLYGAWKATMLGVNTIREGVYSGQRQRMVDKYVGLYGEDYLLNVLHPSFRL